jgi:hypothetical protein
MQADPTVAALKLSDAADDAHASVPDRSIFLPALLVALALVASLGVQSVLLVIERQQLGAADANLVQPEQNATKLRASLEAVATATARLATEGNANARVIVDELRKRGVTINPAGAPKP